MKHPTDDRLLAYVRQQQGQSDVQKHVATCMTCSRRCTELKATGHMIEDWAHGFETDAAYATVSKRVLRTLHTAQLPHRAGQGVFPLRIRLSAIGVFAVLCLILLVGFTAHITGSIASPIITWGPLPTVPSHMATVTSQRATATHSVTGTSRTALVPGIETTCTQDGDVRQHHLHLCGSNFTPGSFVTISYTFLDGKVKRHNVLVGVNGTFIDTLRINSCKDIPVAIAAKSTTRASEVAQTKQYIEFGNC